MKRFARFGLLLSMILGFSTIIMAQQKEMNPKKSEVISWDEAKEAYHHSMSSTFHPAEEGDLEPLKESYSELAINAKNWLATPVPENLSKKELKVLLKKLDKESGKIGKLVEKGASDDELKDAIYALHDVFHNIVGLCQEH